MKNFQVITSTPDKKTPTMLTIKEVSECTKLSYNFIRQLCLNNKIIYVKAGTKYLINYEKFIDFLNTGTK